MNSSTFTDDDKVFCNTPVRLTEGHALVDEAYNEAARAARASQKVVFCPPVATFSGTDAKRVNVVDGVALSVELDAHPQAARSRLEELLGPATVVVASGGMWLNPATGELEPKLHMHYRLSRPARGDERELLGEGPQARDRDCRWRHKQHTDFAPNPMAGKLAPQGRAQLCRIDSLNADREIELQMRSRSYARLRLTETARQKPSAPSAKKTSRRSTSINGLPTCATRARARRAFTRRSCR